MSAADATESPAIIIPARYGSKRFPGKPLHLVTGRSLLERTWRIARAVTEHVYVATDDERIRSAAEAFGARVLMTREDCPTGSDRTYDAARQVAASHVLNLQGDAVLTPPWVLEALLACVKERGGIATPAVALTEEKLAQFLEAKRQSPTSGTTVTFDTQRRALYFSKAVIPYLRGDGSVYRHIGLYAYDFASLQQFAELPQSRLELAEGLEQLRALENGIPVHIVEVDYRGRTHASIDAPSDIPLVEAIIAREGELV